MNQNPESALSPSRLALRRFLKNKAATAGLVILSLLAVAGAAGPWAEGRLYPSPDDQTLAQKLIPPSRGHLFGTDALGRDLFARTVAGIRVSLSVGLCATLVTLLIGVAYGATAGVSPRPIDNLMMRIADLLYALPFTFLVILLLSLFERSFLLLFFALGAVQWLTMARMVRGEVLGLKEREFVSAARALGAGHGRILFRHILPNALGVIAVYATLTVPVVILQEAFLSFLGLTVPGQEHSWGALVSEGVDAVNPVRISWWLIVFPGLFITGTLLSLNFIGDGLRSAADPR